MKSILREKLILSCTASVLAINLGACSIQGSEGESSSESGSVDDSVYKGVDDSVYKGVDLSFGDDPRCSPVNDCGPFADGGSLPAFNAKYIAVVYINFNGKADDLTINHALYDLQGCKATNPQKAEMILNHFENQSNSPQWYDDRGNCRPLKQGSNFQNFDFFGQTQIYMDVDGLDASFDPRHLVRFTKYSVKNESTPVDKNFSFYEAKVKPNSKQPGDKLLYLNNYFTKRENQQSPYIVMNPPTDINRPRASYKWLEYSMNIHLLVGKASSEGDQNVREQIPLIIDPDTGNGTDE